MTGNAPTASPLARISLICIGLMWVLPFLQFHHTHPVPTSYSEALAFALGLAALSLLLAKRYWREMAFPRVAFGLVGLLMVLVLQMFLDMHVYQESALIAAFYLIWAMLLMMLGAVLRKEVGLAGIAAALAWFLLAGGMLSALVGVLQHYQIHSFLDRVIDVKTGSAVFGNLAQPNHFANYTTLSLASLVYLFVCGRLHALAAVPLALPLLFVLALSGSRSAWLYLLVLLALAAWLWWRQQRSNISSADGRKALQAAVLLIVGFVGMQWLAQTPWFAAPMPVITAAARLFDQADGISIRWQLWQEAWLMFLQAPILGTGFGQFSWNHFQLAPLFKNPDVSGIYNNAHNIVMQLLAETGLLGAGAVMGSIVLGLSGLRRQAFDIHAWWLLGLLAIIGIHSLLEYPLWYAYFLGIAAFLLGVGETRLAGLELQRIGRGAMAVVLVIGWLITVNLTQQFYSLEKFLYSPASQPGQSAASAEELHQRLQKLHRESLLAPYIELAYTGTLNLNRENLDAKLELIGRVAHFAPARMVVYQYAIMLALKGENDAALRQVESAAAAYPQELPRFVAILRQLEQESPGTFGPLIDLAGRKMKEYAIDGRAK